jgi:AcrR family transcriptional regulator
VGRREANKAKKRAALLEAGLALFQTQGFDRTSIEQLAAEAGVARGTFYLYFDDKEALFEAVVDRFFEPLLEVFAQVEHALGLAETPEACMAAYQVMAAQLALTGLTHREVVLLVFREMRGQSLPGLRRRERDLIDRITELTQFAMDRRLLRPGDARLSSLVILGGIERLYFEVLAGELDLGAPQDLAMRATVVLSRVLGLDLERQERP